MKKQFVIPFLLFALCLSSQAWGQRTQIKGFANVDLRATDANENAWFFIGEQDLFITSNITDRISFLGETVFKYNSSSATDFSISVERLIIRFNLIGNHNLLIGKHHTPVSYWNDTYHHGRVFFPSVDRPLLFSQGLIEIHTTGVGLQGANLGSQNFGYQIMVGNGIGSSDVLDDNKYKSLTLDAHLKPVRGMKFGLTGYMDKFSSDARDHHNHLEINDTTIIELNPVDIFQLTGGAYFKYFRNKYEFLSEAHIITNNADSIGTSTTQNYSIYAYAGYRVTDKIVPYIKVDFTSIDPDELFYQSTSKQLLSVGMRYEFSYLAVLKMEYNYLVSEQNWNMGQNGLYVQFAVGF